MTQRSPTPSDFNGDGRSDLLLYDNYSDAYIYCLNGPAVISAYDLGYISSEYRNTNLFAVATADLNGDGQPDTIFGNSGGAVVGVTMNGATPVSAQYLADPVVNDPLPYGEFRILPYGQFHFRGFADFNGDGKADTVEQSDTGLIQVSMSIPNASYFMLETVGSTLPTGWTIEGVADFNGDGHPDLLAQSNSGEIVTLLMNGLTITSTHSLGNPGPGWSVAGTGYYAGNNDADIVLHNDNGANVIWDTDGSTITGATSLGNPGAAWNTVVAGLDINGDGNADLVLQNTDGTLAAFTLDGNAAITAGAILGNPGPTWHAVGDDPVFFQDGTNLPYASVQTGTIGVDQFDYTSILAGPHYIAGFDPAQDTVALCTSAFPNYAAVQAAEQTYQGGTFIGFGTFAAIVIQGVTPDKLTAANFVLQNTP